LEFLGIHIDPDASDESREDRVLTTPESSCIALVIGTKEELVIARQTEAVCGVA
jgi:acetate kinase